MYRRKTIGDAKKNRKTKPRVFAKSNPTLFLIFATSTSARRLPPQESRRWRFFRTKAVVRGESFVDDHVASHAGRREKLISGTYASASRYFVVNSPSGRTILSKERESPGNHCVTCISHERSRVILAATNFCNLVDVHPSCQTYSGNMAPNLFGSSATLYLEASQQDVSQKNTSEKNVTQKVTQKAQSSKPNYRWNIVWRNVIAFVYLHLGALYGLYLLIVAAKGYTFIWVFTVGSFGAVGVTGGAHRLWAHRSYKAKWPMRIILMLFQTMAFQNHIYEWVRDHRAHHKFTDTDADPHNVQRGFFFSHMGWLLVRKHPDVIKKGAAIDMSDIEKDFVVVWQRRLYIVLMPVICFLLPTWIPCHFWDEKPMYAWYATLFRYTLSLHLTWLVNSAAHMWGMKPYDNTISPTDSYTVGIGAFGEGWHNYHHVFPWDYKAAELGNYRTNLTTAFIDFFAKIGWAYDLKTVAPNMIKKRAERTGDGSKYERVSDDHHTHEGAIWGWGDADMTTEDIKKVNIINKSD